MSKVKIGEQIAAVRKAAKIVAGYEKPPMLARERDYLFACLMRSAEALEWLQANETAIREATRKGGAE